MDKCCECVYADQRHSFITKSSKCPKCIYGKSRFVFTPKPEEKNENNTIFYGGCPDKTINTEGSWRVNITKEVIEGPPDKGWRTYVASDVTNITIELYDKDGKGQRITIVGLRPKQWQSCDIIEPPCN